MFSNTRKGCYHSCRMWKKATQRPRLILAQFSIVDQVSLYWDPISLGKGFRYQRSQAKFQVSTTTFQKLCVYDLWPVHFFALADTTFSVQTRNWKFRYEVRPFVRPWGKNRYIAKFSVGFRKKMAKPRRNELPNQNRLTNWISLTVITLRKNPVIPIVIPFWG